MSGTVQHEACFNDKKHVAHSWIYSAAGASAAFFCEGIA